MFSLVNEVLNPSKTYYVFDAIEAQRSALLQSHEVIAVTDLGAGSHTGAGRERKVAHIARTALKSPRYAQLLFRLIQHLGYRRVLELGTSLGVTTAYLAAASDEVVSLEGCKEHTRIAKGVAKNLGLAGRMTVLTGAFDDLLLHPLVSGTVGSSPGFDLIFIDGHHRGDALLRYVSKLRPHLNEGGCLVIDDINWSADMRRAWERLRREEEHVLTLDVFEMGLIFTDLDMARQHFVLRY